MLAPYVMTVVDSLPSSSSLRRDKARVHCKPLVQAVMLELYEATSGRHPFTKTKPKIPKASDHGLLEILELYDTVVTSSTLREIVWSCSPHAMVTPENPINVYTPENKVGKSTNYQTSRGFECFFKEGIVCRG